MFFGCAVNGEPMNCAEQDWPMKNDEQRKDYPNRNPNAMPSFPLRLGIFLLIIFHEHFILWTALERARDRKFEVDSLGAAFATAFNQVVATNNPCAIRPSGGTCLRMSADARKRVPPFHSIHPLCRRRPSHASV